ncbi:MAG: hypothetical protein ACI4LQ_01310 [Anaerovoracaceae bacterium]
MRKYMTFLLLAAMIVFPAASLGWISGQLRTAEEKIEITETYCQGDPAAIYGLRLQLQSSCGQDLFWETDCTFQNESMYPTSKSRFCYGQRNTELPEPPSSYFNLNVSHGHDVWEESIEGEQPGLAAASLEIAKNTPAGKNGRRTVRMADYCKYYALSLQARIPFASTSSQKKFFGSSRVILDETAKASWYASLEKNSGQMIMQELQDYFQIPVLEDENVYIEIGRDGSGNVDSAAYGPPEKGSDAYYTSCQSVDLGNAFCFVIQGHSVFGKPMDFSQVPGGYGIYRIPYTSEGALQPDALTMVHSLNPSIEILSLSLSEDGSRILLQTLEDGFYCLTVLHAETFKELQYTAYPMQNTEDHTVPSLFRGENCLAVLSANMQQLMILAEKDDGTYQSVFTARLPEKLMEMQNFTDCDRLLYTDDRLFIAGSLYTTDNGGDRPYGFYIAVYDKTGLLYYGEYETSLLEQLHSQAYSYWTQEMTIRH